MPNVYDQFDVEEQNPYDQFDEPTAGRALTEEELMTGAGPLELAAHPGGEQPYDIYGAPKTSPESQLAQMQGAFSLPFDVPGLAFGAAAKLLSYPISAAQHVLPTVAITSPDQARDPQSVAAEKERQAMQALSPAEFIKSPIPPPEAPKPVAPTKYVTAAQAGITPETPLMDMPPESAKGFEPAIARFLSPMTSSLGFAQLPFFESRSVRALAAAGAISGIPASIEQFAKAKTGAERAEAATTGTLQSLVGLGLLKSLKEKGTPNAIHPENSELHAGMRARHEAEQAGPQMPAQEGGAPAGERGGKESLPEEGKVLLKPEEQAYLDNEREGLGVDVEVSDKPVAGNEPFARQIATIDRKNQKIVIDPDNFSKWLKGVRPDRRAGAVRSLLAEEHIHMLTDDESALGYWNSLTPVEKAISTRRYSGEWQRPAALNDTRMGHEALRFRMQQLSDMTPREVAEASGRERWTVQGLTAIEHVIRTAREKLGTDASIEQAAILNKMMANLNVAKNVVGAGTSPSAISKKQAKDYDKYPEPENRIRELAGLDAASFMSDVTSKEGGLTGDAWKLGLSLKSPDGVQMLRQAMLETSKKIDVAKASKDFNVWGQEGMRNQFFREAYEAATGTGSAAHHFRDDPTYRPPVPSETTPAAIRKQQLPGPEEKWDIDDPASLDRLTVGNLQAIKAKEQRFFKYASENPENRLGTTQEFLGRIKKLQAAIDRKGVEPTVEGVKPLDVQSGRELTATESLAQRLETPKPGPMAMRKSSVKAESVNLPQDLFERLTERMKVDSEAAKYMGFEHNDITTLDYYAQKPESEWNLPGSLKGKLLKWFKEHEGTGFGRIDMLDSHAESELSYAKHLLEQVDEWKRFLEFNPTSEAKQAINNNISKMEKWAQMSIDAEKEQRKLLEKLTGSRYPESARDINFGERREPPAVPPIDFTKPVVEPPPPPKDHPNLPGFEPMAIRKKQIKQSGQEELFLPPILPEDKPAMERGGFPVPTGIQMEQAASSIFDQFKAGQGKIRQPPQVPGPPKTVGQLKTGVPLPRVEPKQVVPELEDFKGAIEAQFGAVAKEKVYHLWMDAAIKQLMEAKGSELTDEIVHLGLKRDVGEALRPKSREPYVGKIPDIMNKEEMDNQIEYVRKMFSKKPWITMEEFKKKFGPEIGRKFSEPFQRRYAAIGAIIDELTKRAGGEPEVDWNRTEIGPEDIMQGYAVENPLPKSEAEKIQSGETPGVELPTIESRRLVKAIPIDSMKDPKAVGEMATAGAAIEASGKKAPPRTVSRNVVAMRGPNGNIVLVSAWKDPRTGPKVTDPTAPTLPGRKINADLLSKWEPLMVMTLREPVQKFHRSFKNQDAFDRWFGDVGIEGTTGLRTSSVVGPIADIYRAQTEAARTSFPRPEEQLPPAPRGQASPFTRELTSRRDVPPTRIPGQPLAKGPSPEPPPIEPKPAEMLSPEELKAVEQQIANESKPMPELYEEIAKVHQFKPTGGGKAYVTSRPQFIIKGKEGLILGPRTRSEPLALRKQQINDETSQLFKSLMALVGRREVKQHLPRILDGFERSGDQYTRAAGDAIILKSFGQAGQKELGAFDPETSRRVQLKEALMRRRAAKAMIASTGRVVTEDKPLVGSDFTPNGLDKLRKDVESGIEKAKLWAVSFNPVQRLWAGKYLKGATRRLEEIDYARDHWDDPQIHAAALQLLKEGKDEVDFENQHGFDVKERAYYLPGRYEGEFWDARQVKFAPLGLSSHFLGQQYRGGKVFRDVYQAIGIGPYIEAADDPAITMQSRIRAGRYRAAQRQAFDLYKTIKDPVTQMPMAKDPKMIPATDAEGHTFYEYVPPSADYQLVYPSAIKRGVPLAVMNEYADNVKSLTAPSQLYAIPFGREALLGASMLKHSWLMIGDVFHGSRLGQYGIFLSGKDMFSFNPGYKGGYAVLNWRVEDLPEAVQKGFITQKAADWATETFPIKMQDGTTREFSRHQIGSELLKQGLNASRIMDAIYKDAVRRIPIIGEPWHKVIGPYNRWLFDEYSSGLMLQQAVINFERLHEKFPDRKLHLLTRDVVRDINIEFGNMGRQGFFKNPTVRDVAQIVMLAPMWREGLLRKEISTYTGLLKAAGNVARGNFEEARYNMSQPVLRSMLRGLAGYFVLTQALNLITRKHTTFQNPEKDHKWDAYIPINKDEGFWLSPMSVFMEMTHRVNYLIGTKPRVQDALLQMGADALGPFGKAIHTLATGKDEYGREIESTPRIWGSAAGQLAPLPMSFGAPARAIGHAVAPNLISPNRPGAVVRQSMGWLGLKVQPSENVLQQMTKKAAQFVKDNDLKPETGWKLVQTDEPSYSALRAAIRNDDQSEALRIFKALRKTHPLKRDKKGNVIEDPILKAMAIWSQRPLTESSYDAEIQFQNSLSPQELENYSAAQAHKMQTLEQYTDWYVKQIHE